MHTNKTMTITLSYPDEYSKVVKWAQSLGYEDFNAVVPIKKLLLAAMEQTDAEDLPSKMSLDPAVLHPNTGQHVCVAGSVSACLVSSVRE